MRAKGTFPISINVEPQIKAPFDARLLAGLFSDLISAAAWEDSDSNVWVYDGMTVTVKEDGKIGTYILMDAENYMYQFAWLKAGGFSPFHNKMYNPLMEGTVTGTALENNGWQDENDGVPQDWDVTDDVLSGTAGTGYWLFSNTRTKNLPNIGDAFRHSFTFDTTNADSPLNVSVTITFRTSAGNVDVSETFAFDGSKQTFVMKGNVADGIALDATLNSIAVEYELDCGDDWEYSNPIFLEGEYADLLNNGTGGGALGYLSLEGAGILDVSIAKHFDSGTLTADKQYTVNQLQVGKSYTLIIHITGSQTQRPDITNLLVASEGKTPSKQKTESLQYIVAGETGYNIQIDVYNIQAASYMYDAYFIN